MRCWPSFIAGICAGTAASSIMMAQPDWWVWLAGGVAATIYSVWKQVTEERSDEQQRRYQESWRSF